MKKCKVHNHAHKIELDAVIIEKTVLIPMPRIDNIEPSKIIEGQCYYTPFYAGLIIPKTAHGYIPFSVVCEWDEFMDFSNEAEVPYPDWVAYYVNWLGYEMEYLNITEEKWGYCSSSGEMVIPPQWDWCDDFGDEFAIVKGMGYCGVIDEYGCVCIYPDYNSICYVDIKRAEGGDGVFFVKTEITGKWGAMDVRYSEFEQEMPDVGYKWDDIWWDGWGGYTVMEKAKDGRNLYGIVNKRNNTVIQNLTKKPVRYDVPTWETRQNTYRDGGHYVSFRILANGEKYGLVVDSHGDTESTKLLLETAHTYEYVLEAAAKEDMEWEIAHYARFLVRIPSHITNAWENVPQDITEDVHKYMDAHNWTQGDWA